MSAQMRGTAIHLRERNYAVHWLKRRSKIPVMMGWSTAPVMTVDDLIDSYIPSYNVGVRCGKWSIPIPGHGLVVIDIDIKVPDVAPEVYEVLYRFYDIDPVFEVRSGSGIGRHEWFACPLDKVPNKANSTLAKSARMVTLKDGKTVPEWTIEVLSTGKNLVVPPSIHPDIGKAYEWLSPIDMDLPLLPESVLEHIASEPESPEPKIVANPISKSTVTRGKFHSGESIADRFKVVSWKSILEPHGWTYQSAHNEYTYWCRPGKRNGVSASTIGDVFYCFSTSTEFKAEKGYSKFSTYALLEHRGDMNRAAKHLAGIKA